VESLRHRTTRMLSVAMIVIGLVLVIQTLVRGDGAWLRIVLGALFVAAGSARIYLQVRGT
jgi:hypothetical protein